MNQAETEPVVTRPRPELLAPAGDWDGLRAAVAHGADAVYFGLERFNARRRATNFTRAALPEIIAYLHDRNVHGYVTFNTLLYSDELPEAVEYVRAIAEAGADAVIVQDLGLVGLIRRMAPTLPIHASTQMTQTEGRGIEFLRGLGVSRVIVARELSLREIAQLARTTRMALEVFVHGALCVSYSGQCLASEALWGRSANRGLCGQACRLPYQLIVDGRQHDVGQRDYPLSPTDLAAYDRLPQLVALGVTGFKIEGRLKSAQYVAAATRIYRAALDAAMRGVGFEPAQEQVADLAQSFSRGFSHGFLDGVNHQTLVPGRFPKHRGVLVGTVVDRTTDGIVVQLATRPDSSAEVPLKPGDGVVFDQGHPEQDEQGGRVYSTEEAPRTQRGAGASATRLLLKFGRGDVNLAAIMPGSQVWKTDDPAIRRRLMSSFGRDVVVHRVPVRARVSAVAGAPLCIEFRDEAGHVARVSSDELLQPAEKHPLTSELVQAQLGRLGDTPFELVGVELCGVHSLADALPVMVPKSILNTLRRRAVQALRDERAAEARHAVVEPSVLEMLRAETGCGEVRRPDNDGPQLYVLVRDWAQLEAVLSWNPPGGTAAPPLIYCDFQGTGDYGRAVGRARTAGRSVGLATARVLTPGEEGELERLGDCGPDVVLVRNLGGLARLRQRYPQLALIGDYSLNVANELTARELLASQFTRLTPSYDLTWKQLVVLAERLPAERIEVVLHQHVPLFHTRHCLFAACLSDGPKCGECGWHCESHDLQLRDRVGACHLVLPDGFGRNTVFHAAAQSAAEVLPALRRGGLRHFRVELLRETAEQAAALLDVYARLLVESMDSSRSVQQIRALCSAGVSLGTYAREELG